MNMDITYLLWLQDLRASSCNLFTPFMQFVSALSVSYALLLPAFIYWCLDKKRGAWIFASLCYSMALTSLVKLTACVYRPWIRDPRIVPVGKLPGSYSFPSGHTSMGTPIYLGSAISLWPYKHLFKIIALLCVLLLILNPFSRNYLGVHTPQDVCVGFLISLVCLYATWKGANYFEKHPEKENLFLLGVALTCIAALIFVVYKPYPMDYVNGKLIVNPQKMIKSGYESFGALFAYCVSRYIEKTWIRFEVTGCNGKGMLYCFVGCLGLCGLFTYIRPLLNHVLGRNWGAFTLSFLLIFYIIALYPWILKYCMPKKS